MSNPIFQHEDAKKRQELEDLAVAFIRATPSFFLRAYMPVLADNVERPEPQLRLVTLESDDE